MPDQQVNPVFETLEYIAGGSLFKDAKAHNIVLGGTIDSAPESVLPLIYEELRKLELDVIPEVTFPKEPLSYKEAQAILNSSPPSSHDLQIFFEIFKALSKFVKKPQEKELLEKLWVSEDIQALELTKKFGLFSLSHVKLLQGNLHTKKKKALNYQKQNENKPSLLQEGMKTNNKEDKPTEFGIDSENKKGQIQELSLKKDKSQEETN